MEENKIATEIEICENQSDEKSSEPSSVEIVGVSFREAGKIYYFAPMTFLHGKRVSANWLFQKQYSLKALNDEELEKISQLTKDVVQTCKMEPSFQKLLNVMDKQIGLYKQLTQTKPDASTKKHLLYQLKLSNNLISNVNVTRTHYLNHFSK